MSMLTAVQSNKSAFKDEMETESLGGRHSSVDSSAPSSLWPRVRVPSTPPTHFSIYIVQIEYLSFEFECEKNENKQKVAGIGPFLKKTNDLR